MSLRYGTVHAVNHQGGVIATRLRPQRWEFDTEAIVGTLVVGDSVRFHADPDTGRALRVRKLGWPVAEDVPAPDVWTRLVDWCGNCEDNAMTGTVSSYDRELLWGWIAADHDDRRFFVHRSDVLGPVLRAGERVEFDPAETSRGPRAVRVKRVNVTAQAHQGEG